MSQGRALIEHARRGIANTGAWARWDDVTTWRRPQLMLGPRRPAAAAADSLRDSPSRRLDRQTPVTITVWHHVRRRRVEAVRRCALGLSQEVPLDPSSTSPCSRIRRGHLRPQPDRGHQGRQLPDVAIALRPELRRPVLLERPVERPDPVHAEGPRMSISTSRRPTLTYTKVRGNQCALPSLTDAYGLYYNKQMLATAGISSPPKTMDRAADCRQEAHRQEPRRLDQGGGLCAAQPVGRARVAESASRAWGDSWFDSVRQGAARHRSSWTAAFESQKSLVDWYGYANLEKFARTYTNAEFNPSNAFETDKIAMVFDGEWRTAFITSRVEHLARRAAPARRRPGRPARPASSSMRMHAARRRRGIW